MRKLSVQGVVIDLAAHRSNGRHVAGPRRPPISALDAGIALPTAVRVAHERPVSWEDRPMPLLEGAFDDLLGMGVNAREAGR